MDERYRILARIPKGQGEPEEVVRAKTITNKMFFVNDPNLDWYRDNVPCRRACPAETRIPEYIDAAARGEYEKCYEINVQDNVLPHLLWKSVRPPVRGQMQTWKRGDGRACLHMLDKTVRR